jgi:hypothetical protein
MLGISSSAPDKTLDDIRGLVMQIAPDVRISMIQDIFARLNVAKLSDIPADKYNWVYDSLSTFFKQ